MDGWISERQKNEKKYWYCKPMKHFVQYSAKQLRQLIQHVNARLWNESLCHWHMLEMWILTERDFGKRICRFQKNNTCLLWIHIEIGAAPIYSLVALLPLTLPPFTQACDRNWEHTWCTPALKDLLGCKFNFNCWVELFGSPYLRDQTQTQTQNICHLIEPYVQVCWIFLRHLPHLSAVWLLCKLQLFFATYRRNEKLRKDNFGGLTWPIHIT